MGPALSRCAGHDGAPERALAFAGLGTENGGLTRANGDRFRALILSRGNTADYAQMFREFRGRDPVIEPMLAHRGIGAR